LSGRCIIVTRPPRQAHGLAQSIEACGGVAECIPVMTVEAAPMDEVLIGLINRLDEFSLAFFVSANAVEHGMAAVRRLRAWPASLAVATVGPGSERALHEAGFDQVIAPSSGFDSESVLALPEFVAEAVTGKGIIIFRGNGGRDLLGDTLTERGASVAYAACYQRKVPEDGAERLLALADKADAIVLTSSEGVGNLAAMLGETVSRLHVVPVICSHPRIAARARAAGFRTVVETPAGDDGLIKGMEDFFRVESKR